MGEDIVTLGQGLRVYESKKREAKKALGNCAPNSVLLIAHVTTPYVNLPVVDFTLAVHFTVGCILYAIILNY